MKKAIILLCTMALLACNTDENLTNSPNGRTSASRYESNSNTVLKKEFGLALAKAIAEHIEVRDFLKKESLKRINHDSDVIYQLVKNESLTDGNTFEEILLKYINEEKLSLIIEKIPTLTIFVPTLPENHFSPENWDIEKDIPVVALKLTETNDVPMVNASGEEWILEAQYTPIDPVVVIKENERVKVNTQNESNLQLRSSSNTTNLSFIDEIFDNTKQDIELRRDSSDGGGRYPNKPETPLNPEVKKVIDAYNIFRNTNNWHRDYIYYNLTQTQQRGVLTKNIKEYLVGFKLINGTGSGDDATDVINKICDQTEDPKRTGGTGGIPASLWTDGELEFLIRCSVASTTGIGTEIKKYLRIKPSMLFKPVGFSYGRGQVGYYAYKFTLYPDPVKVDLALFEWNLETISPSVKISIEEVDDMETIKQTSSSTTEFATNFEYSIAGGESTKVGFKFGASAKKTMTVAYEQTTSKGNDQLGDEIINFWDDVIKSDKYSSYKDPDTGLDDYNLDYATYTTGWCNFQITPKIR